MSHDPADLLTVILDLNPLAWADLESGGAAPERSTSLLAVMESFLIFANSHLALRHENAIAVYGVGLGSCQLLYSSLQAKPITNSSSQPSSSRDANTYQSFRILNDSIANGVKQLAALAQSTPITGKQPGIVKALAKALCRASHQSGSSGE